MARRLSRPHEPFMALLPGVEDGLRGMALIEAATQSNEQDNRWVHCRT